MNNNEKILKYFSDDLSYEQKKSFENELENSAELKKEFLKFHEKLSELKNAAKPKTEENYFINLTPRIREKIKKKKQPFTIPKLAVSFAAAAVVVILLLLNNEEPKNIFSIEENKTILIEVIEETPNELLYDYFNLSPNSGGNNFSLFADIDEYDEQVLEKLGEKTLKSFNEFELIDDLNEETADEIYNQLLNTKIL